MLDQVAKSNFCVNSEHAVVDLSFENIFDSEGPEKADYIQEIVELGHVLALPGIALVEVFVDVAFNVFQQLRFAIPAQNPLRNPGCPMFAYGLFHWLSLSGRPHQEWRSTRLRVVAWLLKAF